VPSAEHATDVNGGADIILLKGNPAFVEKNKKPELVVKNNFEPSAEQAIEDQELEDAVVCVHVWAEVKPAIVNMATTTIRDLFVFIIPTVYSPKVNGFLFKTTQLICYPRPTLAFWVIFCLRHRFTSTFSSRPRCTFASVRPS
jgi:hypothetical protein